MFAFDVGRLTLLRRCTCQAHRPLDVPGKHTALRADSMASRGPTAAIAPPSVHTRSVPRVAAMCTPHGREGRSGGRADARARKTSPHHCICMPPCRGDVATKCGGHRGGKCIARPRGRWCSCAGAGMNASTCERWV
eukprot:5345276-Prymnesium_polylepis.1